MSAHGAPHSRQADFKTAAMLPLSAGLARHQAGDLDQAELIYRQILSQSPGHADALHLLGLLKNRQRDHEQAERLIRRAIEIQPRQAVFYSNLGVVLMARGEIFSAIDAYQIAELLAPDSAQNLNNLAVALHAIGETDQAITCVKRAFLLSPEYTDARDNLLRLSQLQPESAGGFHALGDVLFDAGRPGEAVIFYRRSLQRNPQSAETQNNLGNALYAHGQKTDAQASYRRALELNPEFCQAWNNLANCLREDGQLADSLAAYQRAMELQPNSADTISNAGVALVEMKEFTQATRCYHRALALDPFHASTHNNVGNLLCITGEWSAAIQSYQRALAVKPNYADAINNLGTALEETGDRDEAMACYEKAKTLDCSLVSPPWNIALLQLLRGEFETGWLGYEHRWSQKKQSRTWRDFEKPVLINLHIPPGTRILLHAEQGFGDAIQFCRYAPLLAGLGMRVILECPVPLVGLFHSLAGVEQIIARGEPLSEFDVHCPLMSLPKVFRTTLESIPADSYLRAPNGIADSWEKRFRNGPRSLRVGLVWAGQSTHQKDQHRSLPLSAFADLGTIPGITFFSLQLGDAATQANSPPPGMRLIDHTPELSDFAQTAGLISHLDLVITVDTAVCHLTGAIGKPVWILIPFQPDWRWLLDRSDSPWYPPARLFRQNSPGDWSDPMARLAIALKDLQARTTA